MASAPQAYFDSTSYPSHFALVEALGNTTHLIDEDEKVDKSHDKDKKKEQSLKLVLPFWD